MTDKIIDAAAAQGLQAYAVRTYRLSGWIVMQDQPGYPGKIIARLSAGTPRRMCCWPIPWPSYRLSYRLAWCVRIAS